MIEIGRVGKPHGVRGGFHLDGAIEFEALVAGFRVTIDGAEYTVASRGGLADRPLVTLLEIGDRDAINALRGNPVLAPRESLTPLSEGEWYATDLIGLKVMAGGATVGVVEKLSNLPSVDVLEVRLSDDETLQLPMIKDAILAIDPEAGTIEVDNDFLNLDLG
jgi:16S rRNA processing protein RimM